MAWPFGRDHHALDAPVEIESWVSIELVSEGLVLKLIQISGIQMEVDRKFVWGW